MIFGLDLGPRVVAAIAVPLILGGLAENAMAQTVEATATYKERMALPSGAVLEATIEEVSRADAPATVIASTRVTSPGNPPIAFTIAFDQAKILANHRYVVRAKILLERQAAVLRTTSRRR
jgi:uncharacterized lipoprotein YbaY